MLKRVMSSIGIVVALLVVPAIAGASVAFTKIAAPYTFNSQSLNPPIYVANDNGTGARKLSVSGGFPVISPDGTMIAYTVTHKNWTTTLHFVTIATGADFNTQTFCTSPVWAPNSSAVACEAMGPGPTDTGLITLTPTGTSTKIYDNTDTTRVAGSATWSSDSSIVAWELDLYPKVMKPGTNAVAKLRGMKADGTGSLLKLGNGSRPIWGPTGTPRIAFAVYTTVKSNPMGSGQTWTVEATGDMATPLTSYKPQDMWTGPMPNFWTPNGGTIVGAITGMDDDAYTVSINTTSGKIKALGNSTPYSNRPAAVSADGKTVLVTYYSQACCASKSVGIVRTVPVAGGTYSPFLSNVSFISASANWQP
jgi:WD40-like Beta Propeller Repeat